MMSKQNQGIGLSLAAFAMLLKRSVGKLGGHSPLVAIPETDQPPTSEELATLTQAGLLDGDAASDNAVALLKPFLACKASAGVLFIGGATSYDLAVYRDGDGGAMTAYLQEDRVWLDAADGTAGIGNYLRNRVGISVDTGFPLEVALTNAELAATLSIVDLRRRQLLGALLDRTTGAPMLVNELAVASWWSGTPDNLTWLALRAQAELGLPASIDRAAFAAALGSLTEKELLFTTGADTLPGPDLESLANHFLLVPQSIQLHSRCLADTGETLGTQTVAWRSGLGDLLIVEPGADGTWMLATTSPAMLAASAEALLTDPAAMTVSS